MSERGDKVWVLADETWQWASYEFRVTKSEPLGQHSVFLESGGGRRVLCGCKVLLERPAAPVVANGHQTCAGNYAGTINELIHRLELCVAEEQEQPLPRNHFIAVMCDAIRFAREEGAKPFAPIEAAAAAWVHCNERLPEDAFTRLVFCGFRTVAFYELASWWRNGALGAERLPNVTHWMPIPPGPGEPTK